MEINKGSEWMICDLQIQTIIDDRYQSLKEYYKELKTSERAKWDSFISKVGGEENALIFDSKEYFNNTSIPKKERANNYVRTLFSFLEVFNPNLKLIGITDHNYYDELLIDAFYEYSRKSTCKVICGIEINVAGVHVLVYFGKPPYEKETFSEGLKTFLSKIGIDSHKTKEVLTISNKGIFDVLEEICNQNGIYVFPHCNSDNGLFQERGKTDRTNLSEIFNFKKGIILQANSNESISKTKEYIIKNPKLFTATPICTIASDGRALKDFGRCDKLGNFQWIKAEPTFEGLKQIITEPSRVFIGELPPIIERVNKNPTKYIKAIEISKVQNSSITDFWFDNFRVDFNSELVAIIGNKGKGKSALSDILGLCGNAHIEEEDFSFLNKNKFRSPRPNLAREYEGKIYWEGGDPDSKILDSLPDKDSPEKVKYIPQSFLEKLCTSVDKKVFEEELEKVIFSRLESYQKLGKGSLKEVLIEKKQTLEDEISKIKSNISSKNTDIIELERKNSAQFRRSIDESLQTKENELKVHIENEPPKKEAPKQDEKNQQRTLEVTTQITSFRDIIKNQQDIKEKANSERVRLTVEMNELTQSVQKLNALAEYIKLAINQNETILNKYDIKLQDLVKYSIEITPINELILAKSNRIKEIEKLFENDNPSNPNNLITNSEVQIKKLQDELEGENKEYQKYLTAQQEWEKQKVEIIVTDAKDGTLSYFKNLKTYLDTKIGNELKDANKARIELLKQVIETKVLIAEVYKELYKPVSEFISENNSELIDYNVNIDVSLELDNFPEKFFNYISNGAAGNFRGASESRQLLSKITEVVDFNNPKGVAEWVDKIIQYLKFDNINEQKIEKDLQPQLKGGFTAQNFYDFLFNMDYYEPTYQLKLGKKKLNELSPGERGALLLIFYLLLDKQDIPIIIDQPEENLDNQSVYSILVHFIKKAKERRQIIIVTHNPNLAVVCDAEQVIRMDIDKENKNKVSRITGGIENQEINKAIVDILEGTRPAFNNRTSKYKISNN